jgi:NAD(P)-dependent dehydrogenase (short-subunit alcohol dehydrogenase family)
MKRWLVYAAIVPTLLVTYISLFDSSSLPFLSATTRLSLSSIPWTNRRTSQLDPQKLKPGMQSGKVVVVTGGNAGIGLETVRQLAEAGATVVMTSRSVAKGVEARNQLMSESPDLDIRVLQLDLTDLVNVREFAAAFAKTELKKIDALVLNAGTFPRDQVQQTTDGFELMFGVHHVGHFFLFKIMLPYLVRSDDPRLVVTSSAMFYRLSSIDWQTLDDVAAAESNLGPALLYSQSKLANVLFAKEASRRFGDRITVTVNHPGLVRTKILGDGSMVCEKIPGFCFEPELGAAANVLGCIGPAEELKGRFLLPRGVVADWELDIPAVNATLGAELWTWTEKAIATKLKLRGQ